MTEHAMVSSPALVGRGGEVAEVSRALAAGAPLVLVEGEAGIGKTRLVREALAGPVVSDAGVLVAACPPFREPYTLGPIVDAARSGRGRFTGTGLSALAGVLRPLFPEWADDLPPAPRPLDDVHAARHRLFRALAELIDRLDPGVLVVEDAHWADESTLEFLLFLAASAPGQPSLLVTYRPEEVSANSSLRRLTARSEQVRVTLAPLDITGTTELVSSMLGGDRVAPDLAAYVLRTTAGIPLVAEELVRLLSHRSALECRDGQWDNRDRAPAEVPPTVRDAVLERVDRCSPDIRAILRAAAVLGEPASVDVLAEVADLGTDHADAVSGAVRTALVRAGADGLVSYRHALAAQAVYQAIPGDERQSAHLRAAHTLERLSPPPAARLAHHYRAAKDRDGWCRYAELAADLARASSDEATAGALVYDLLVNGDPPADSVARLIRKIPNMTFTGTDRFDRLESAIRAVVNRDDIAPGDNARIRMAFGRMLGVAESRATGRSELKRALAHLPPDSAEAVLAMTSLGQPSGDDSGTDHRRWLWRARTATPPMSAYDRLVLAGDIADALLVLGEPEGWDLAVRLPETAATPADWGEVTRSQNNIGNAAMLWGRYDHARRSLNRASELAAKYQFTRIGAVSRICLAHLDYLAGAWSGLPERAAELADEDAPLPVTRMEAVLVAGLLDLASGGTAVADERLDGAFTEFRRRGVYYLAVESAAALCRSLLGRGRVEDALAVTDWSAEVVEHKDTWIWATDLVPARVGALIVAGRHDAAIELTAKMRSGLHCQEAPGPLAGLVLCDALLAEARGSAMAAEGFATAARAFGRMPRPYDALLARERRAGCLIAAGDPETGLAELREIYSGLTDLGARADADRVAGRMRAIGIDNDPRWPGRRGYGPGLSPRELDVVRLLVTGQTNRQIAEALSRSTKTIEAQVNSAMRKLNVSSRTALAVAVVRAGVIDGGD